MRLDRLIAEHLPLSTSGWSMGSFGAIAEFHQDEGEPAVIDLPGELTRVTRRGGVRFDVEDIREVVPVAYETLSPRRHRWSQGVALCMAAAVAPMNGRNVLTELGPDDAALRRIDRTGILFDMGLAQLQCDFCIRTSDPKLLKILRAALGRSLFEPDNPAMTAILKAHPHRVALTRIGRLEVYQKIGGPDTGGVSPPGPHTHVLPKLLRSGRTHSANTPIPLGLTPVAYLHPGNPVIGPMGEDREFDPALHDAFQKLLAEYGLAEAVAEKRRFADAFTAALEPSDFAMPKSRIGRVAVRLALRQFARRHETDDDDATKRYLAAWKAVIEPARGGDDEDDDAPGH